MFLVDGGPYGEFDVPAVRAFVRVFAPRRGEIVVDVEALDLTPPKTRSAGDRPKAPRRKPGPRRKARTQADPAADGPPAEPGADAPPQTAS